MRSCFYFHLKNLAKQHVNELDNIKLNSWDELAEHIINLDVSNIKKDKLITQVELSKNAIKSNDWNYFQKCTESKNQYKFLEFTKNIAYIDIETTGLSKQFHEITTIGIYDGKNSKIFVQGIDLHEAFEYLDTFDLIVTFNGKQFDVPFIEHHFNEKINAIHLDLRYMLKEFNLSGGLKRIERELGLTRDEEVKDIDGFEAIRLWKRYKSYNDLKSLEKLKKYNIEDIENLEILLNWYLKNKKFI